MFRLDGKTAFVTGASRGIGREIAFRMAEQGARVIVAARSFDKLEELAAEIGEAGGDARPLRLDLAQPAEIPEQLEELGEDRYQVDVLVNNAGITHDVIVARMKLEEWQAVLDTNLTSGFVLTRALLRGMVRKRWGRVLFVSSVVGLMGNTGQANYAASKAGMIGFAKSLAQEMGSRNITANVIAPGLIETAMTGELADGVRQKMLKEIVMRRPGTAREVAAAAVFLASDEAAYVTGEVLNVSGGLYM
ncbi:MAG: 3-oxoacyl-[acyl-carrier-protein] reductase [Thermoanaerobaculia bacterium]